MNGLIIKDILMSETNAKSLPKGAKLHEHVNEVHRVWNNEPKQFTHDQVIEVGGEYLKCKKTGRWVSENNVENYEIEKINIEIQQYYEQEQDRYY